MVKKKCAAVVAGLGLAVAGVAVPASSAHAASLPTVSSPSCGTIRINPRAYTGSAAIKVFFDAGFYEGPVKAGGAVVTDSGLPGGQYTYALVNATTNKAVGGGSISVAKCSAGRSRTVEGDANGDGKADVFATTKSGALIYYRMTSAGLQTVKTVFTSGFASTIYIQRVTEVTPDGSTLFGFEGRNYLFAVRSDGTLWRYLDSGSGKIGAGVKIGSGLAGYSNFAISQTNGAEYLGSHLLYATKNGTLYAFGGLGNTSIGAATTLDGGWSGVNEQISLKAYDRNGFADWIVIAGGDMFVSLGNWNGIADAVKIGHGWNAMQLVVSPGDVTGDGLSDLVARRSDGNLYRYINTGKGWGPAVQIGKNWNNITALG